jgi:hypothetical protein
MIANEWEGMWWPFDSYLGASGAGVDKLALNELRCGTTKFTRFSACLEYDGKSFVENSCGAHAPSSIPKRIVSRISVRNREKSDKILVFFPDPIFVPHQGFCSPLVPQQQC